MLDAQTLDAAIVSAPLLDEGAAPKRTVGHAALDNINGRDSKQSRSSIRPSGLVGPQGRVCPVMSRVEDIQLMEDMETFVPSDHFHESLNRPIHAFSTPDIICISW
ncbi:hypothetical protein E1301_Tti022004 [Triplophysa tibetana]|uniref:Uncharacterized protein n=1 Tax=Triplophysa tibetana TaxID=1572043 RepID=A0A5A9NH10_9TELE|nr:hypothetical protein E1301_Tti022004 [Triplophysa tibetana]